MLHNVECQKVTKGARCSLSPLSPKTKGYRIRLATDQPWTPEILLAARNIEIMDKDEYFNKYGGVWGKLSSSKTMALLGLLIATIVQLFLFVRLYKRLNGRLPPILTGKIVDQEMRAVEGARVEISMEDQDKIYGPLLTDSAGDFILGSLSKRAKLSGSIRVSRDGYLPSESQLDSPIILQILQKKPDEKKVVS